MKRHFYYLSQDGKTKIHAIEWIPEGNISAILQISHGMVEYIDRYDEFARFLNKQGYYVVGHDHLGHGDSVQSKENWGYFNEKNGNECVIGDIHQLRQLTQEKYPAIPYFLLGHSMGSFLVRQYLTIHGLGLSGAIIMGTGNQPLSLIKLGKILCRIIASFKGWHYRSNFVNNMAFGGYNKKFFPSRTSMDWLSRNPKNVDTYLSEDRCRFIFTVNGYYHMFRGIEHLAKDKNFKQIPKQLPVLFIAGEEDPVGNFGKGVKAVFQKYKDGDIKDVSLKLYKNDRHEILNEEDRQTIYMDIYQWLETKRISCTH
ncbi:alpha/beta fold hydrolase [Faecalimonas sp.]